MLTEKRKISNIQFIYKLEKRSTHTKLQVTYIIHQLDLKTKKKVDI